MAGTGLREARAPHLEARGDLIGEANICLLYKNCARFYAEIQLAVGFPPF